MPRPSRSLAVLAALLGAAGCDSPLDPGDVAGTFVVESIGGAPLPVELFNHQSGRAVLVADTLRLGADRKGTRTIVSRYQAAGAAAPGPAQRVVTQLTYRLRDGRIEISIVCPPTALCTNGPHLTGPATQRELRLEGQPGPYVYRRTGD